MRDLWNGVAPDHRPALLAVLFAAALAVPGARVVRAHAVAGMPWAVRLLSGVAAAGPAERWAAALLAVAAAVHLGLPLGHDGGVFLTVSFLGSGALYAWLAHRAVTGRRWRLGVALLVPANLLAYLIVVGRGEEADQVGLAAALVELVAFGLALGRRRRLLGACALSFVTLVFGVAAWVLFALGHDSHGAAAHTGSHAHGPHLARGQAGIIMRPGATGTTAAQRQAATAFAAQVQAATARYADLAVAEVDGYRLGGGPVDGLGLHFEHKGHQADARVLDPQRPELLVYARQWGRAVLLGVVFQMPRAGERGPEFGGAETPWHTHNICVGLTPPGFGVVTPFGTCPFLTAHVTIAEMIHVWVVDNPSGRFADGVPDDYARTVLARDGRPAPSR